MKITRITITGLATLGLSVVGGTAASAAGDGPTCSGVGGIANHGQHIVGDYVIGGSGIGSGLEWPYDGTVGQAVSAAGGAAHPGAPGRHGHVPFAPGASFCTESSSPGDHLSG